MTYRDPLSAALYARGICHGYKGLDKFVPITPEERDAIRYRLDLDGKNMVCTNCGSTKPQAYYDSIGAISCCPSRKMVEALDLVSELARLKARNATLRKGASKRRARTA